MEANLHFHVATSFRFPLSITKPRTYPTMLNLVRYNGSRSFWPRQPSLRANRQTPGTRGEERREPPHNRVTYKEGMGRLLSWCDQQCIPIGAALFTAWHAVEMFPVNLAFKTALDFFLPAHNSTVHKLFPRDYHSMLACITGSPWIYARNMVVYRGCYAFIIYLMGRFRGKEDIFSRMVGGLVHGVIISLVTGVRGRAIIPVALIHLIICGLMFKLQGESKPDRN